MKRNIYLNTKTKEDAFNEYIDIIKENYTFKKEVIRVIDSLNRISADIVYALNSNPYYNSSAMDGIATKSYLTKEASDDHYIKLVRDKDYIEVDTGDYINDEFDAVIMAEDLVECEDGYYIHKSVIPYENIRTVGEDIITKDVIVNKNHKINGLDIGAMIAAGIKEIEVYQKVNVLVIATGDELIDFDQKIERGLIYDSNSYMLQALISELDVNVKRHNIIKDDYEIIKNTIIDNIDKYDLILINAGSSAGRDDYSVKVIKELGTVYTHGILIKPGKPTILGMIKQTAIIGIPGFPSSAYLSYYLFARPIIEYMSGLNVMDDKKYQAILSKSIISSLKYEEYIRVKLGIVNNKLIATPLKRGAGSAMNLIKSDGFMIVPKSYEGYKEDSIVDVISDIDLEDIKNTIVVSGSHDMILDLIDNNLKEYRVSSTHIGSYAGLIALKNNKAHLAPSHIFDPITNTYNIETLKKLFDDINELVIIKAVKRKQGLIVKKGNPLKIKDIKDIKDLRYINRQKGAGTRILFDYLLNENDLNKEDINGYYHEVNTHMEVAEAIKADNADVGMGIYASAKALDLDFIAIKDEEYDFITKREYLDLKMIQEFINYLKSDDFKMMVESLGGYETSQSGEIIYLK